MKNLFLVLAVMALVFSSCGNKEKKQDEGTHTHEDGTVHEAHAADAANQEAFEVKDTSACAKSCAEKCAKECSEKKDTTKCCPTEAEEKHAEGHDHDHGDEGHSHE
ncbi:hypothetical protein [Carboxylicivirga sp. N1Y90]|uniref:hypothetical protein n=1 Tax=Carboxylicivirga fragile TaxID=3417571 RepID=UPI003D33DF99|nr:hypothetical protein [Marinilabiliaceae bacterium N1Y90]